MLDSDSSLLHNETSGRLIERAFADKALLSPQQHNVEHWIYVRQFA